VNIIFVTRKHGKARTISLGNGWIAGIGGVGLLALLATFGFGYLSAVNGSELLRQQNYVDSWLAELKLQAESIGLLKQDSDLQMKTLTIRMAKLHAKLLRLDALGEHLISTAKFDSAEFDFSTPPALGGSPQDQNGVSLTPPSFVLAIEQLSEEIQSHERELQVLNTLLGNEDFESDRYISGKPVHKGWLSSKFGRRNDPFTGRIAWHEGVDFAGKLGSDVVSVAAGVVTWAGPRSGYGKLVEVNHGGQFATRYAHANKLLVGLGDVIQKGDTIALMGSSGRSTGPHVHFEVLKNGNPVDPYRYIKRTGR